MKRSRVLILGAVVSLVFISTGLIFSQDQGIDEGVTAPIYEEQGESLELGGAIPQEESEPETQWLWGEVIALDAARKTITVKYLDYETDQEKEINITAGDKTTFEGLEALDELDPGDNVSVDYIVGQGGNIAKNISLENPEAEGASGEEISEGSAPDNDLEADHDGNDDEDGDVDDED